VRLPQVVPALVMALTLTAQDFDPLTQAPCSWARLDKDGSCTFHDAGGKRLVTWSRETGTQNVVDLSRFTALPDHFVLDSYNNAWVVSGTNLQLVEKGGKLGTRVRLPAEVADLDWDTRGFVLSYRTREPYVEKRDYKSGAVLWAWGAKPGAAEAAAPTQLRITVTPEGELLHSRAGSLSLGRLDDKGKPGSPAVATYLGGQVPSLVEAERGDRGPLVWWNGRTIALAAVPGSQVPAAKKEGLLLMRTDLSQGTVEFLPTGLGVGHLLIGAQENEAVFVKPGGGLVYVPIK
jgi:hypothetical protein